jgi:hypothetical protein
VFLFVSKIFKDNKKGEYMPEKSGLGRPRKSKESKKDKDDVDSPNPKNFASSLFAAYKVTSEDQLLAKLYRESFTITCICCHHDRPLDLIHFINDDPVCSYCLEKPRHVLRRCFDEAY